MQTKNVKIVVCLLSAALLFSGMNIDAFAKDANGLPSAGVDYFFSNNGTSVKSLQEEAEATAEKTESIGNTVDMLQTASPTISATVAPTSALIVPQNHTQVQEVPAEEIKEPKIIEETMIVTTTKSVSEKEKELEVKKEEEHFKTLVIADVNDYVNVRSIPGEDGEILGKLYDDSVGEFISEKDGWYEITSGSVTGFVKAEYCVTGEEAVALAREVGTRIATVTTTTLFVREEPSTEAAVIGMVPIEDELLVKEELEEWVKVDIEEGEGHVSLDYVTLSTEFVKAESKAEEEARLAEEEAERRAAQAAAQAATAKKTPTGSQEVKAPEIPANSSSSALGQAVADFACQFVGNPYVWGGTSLTNGADCSGFVMSVYANFGVSLPHSSAADRNVGYAVNGLENAQPGDLICYSGHVALYIGNGQIVHASTSKTGIIISNASYRSILSIRRIF